MYLHEPSSALDVAIAVTDHAPENLSATAKRLYMALCWASIEVAKSRDYCHTVTEVTFFAPAESVALACGIHPATLYRKLPELREAGLVDCRGHYTTLSGKTRSDGSVWAVRLSPTRGSAARVPYDYLRRQWRSLGADIDSGKTAWAMMRESKLKAKDTDIQVSYITAWALSPTCKAPVTVDSRTIDLEAIFDVPHAETQHRPDAIYAAALAISRALGDGDSTRFYCKLLWGLLRLRLDGENYFDALHLMVKRAQVDVLEGFSRRGGAVLTSRLKQAAWYERATNGIPTCAGPKTIRA